MYLLRGPGRKVRDKYFILIKPLAAKKQVGGARLQTLLCG